MLVNTLDRFIGESLSRQQDTLYKARLLVGALACFILSVLGFFPFFAIVDGLPANAIWAYTVIALPLLVCWLIIMALLKQGRAYKPAAHCVILSINLVLFTGIAVTGGPVGTEVHPLLFTPVLFAFLLLGQRSGAAWAMVTLVVYLLFYLAQFNGVEFINMAPAHAKAQLRLFNFTYAFIICTALVLIYDAINRNITKERDVEREKLQQLAHMAINSTLITDSASHLQQTGNDLQKASIEQKTAIEELATTAEQLSATAEQNSTQAAHALQAINDTEQQIDTSQKDIQSLQEAVTQTHTLSNEIQSINNIINDIAYQTNLLSLNAMIEASRTDENGGFKVVALEVKKLAERASDAASTINELLTQNKDQVEQSVGHAETIRQCFDDISDRILPLVAAVQNISDASFEQSEAIRQVNAGLTEIDRAIGVSRKMADFASETADALQDNTAALTAEMQTLDEHTRN